MTTAGTLARLGVDPNEYPVLFRMPLDYAIRRLREIRANDREYYAAINRGHDGEDEAYERWRDSN